MNFPSSKQAEHEKKNAWRQYVFTFGKYKGKSLDFVHVRDLDYIKRISCKDYADVILQVAIKKEEITVNGAITAIEQCRVCLYYLQKTDPYYTPGFSVKSKYPTKGVVLGN